MTERIMRRVWCQGARGLATLALCSLLVSACGNAISHRDTTTVVAQAPKVKRASALARATTTPVPPRTVSTKHVTTIRQASTTKTRAATPPAIRHRHLAKTNPVVKAPAVTTAASVHTATTESDPPPATTTITTAKRPTVHHTTIPKHKPKPADPPHKQLPVRRSPVKRLTPKEPKAPRSQSRQVVSCLHLSGVSHATKNATFLWVGWGKSVDGFVYVQLYPTRSAASKEAHYLAAEESGLAGKLAISQHITPYVGSPVPRVVKCLHGKMVSKPPHKRKETFTF